MLLVFAFEEKHPLIGHHIISLQIKFHYVSINGYFLLGECFSCIDHNNNNDNNGAVCVNVCVCASSGGCD